MGLGEVSHRQLDVQVWSLGVGHGSQKDLESLMKLMEVDIFNTPVRQTRKKTEEQRGRGDAAHLAN